MRQVYESSVLFSKRRDAGIRPPARRISARTGASAAVSASPGPDPPIAIIVFRSEYSGPRVGHRRAFAMRHGVAMRHSA